MAKADSSGEINPQTNPQKPKKNVIGYFNAKGFRVVMGGKTVEKFEDRKQTAIQIKSECRRRAKFISDENGGTFIGLIYESTKTQIY